MTTTTRGLTPELNTPNALETALAQQVASGTSPFAASLLLGYGAQRNQAYDQLNTAQSDQYSRGLTAATQQEKLKALGSALNTAMTSGRGLGALEEAAGAAGIAQFTPQDVVGARRREDMAATAEDLSKAGTGAAGLTASGNQPDLTSYLAGEGVKSTLGQPEGITKEGMGNKTALEVARINAAAKDRATAAKAASGGGGSKEFGTVQTQEGGKNVSLKVAPEKALAMEGLQLDANGQLERKPGARLTATGAAMLNDGPTKAPSGDPMEQDPAIAKAKAGLISQGYHIIPDAPVTYAERDGRPGKLFSVIDVNGVKGTRWVPD